MFGNFRTKAGIATLSVLWFASAGNVVEAQSLVPAHLNGWVVLSANTSGFSHQAFVYDTNNSTIGAPTSGVGGNYDSFTFDDNTPGGGAGVGWNVMNNLNAPYDQLGAGPVEPVDFSITDSNGVSTFDALDRGSFGANFNPNEYVIEVLYKTNPNTNTSGDFSVMMEQWDGFEQTAGATFGQRKAEQLQWGANQSGVVPAFDPNTADGVGGINEYFTNANNPHDSDGFAILRIPMSSAAPNPDPNGPNAPGRPQYSGQSYMFDSGNTAFAIDGDATADLDAFEDSVPNGLGQFHIQAPYGALGRLVIEVKDIRIVPATRNPTVVARFDAKSGIGRRFGTPFFVEETDGGEEFLQFDHDNDGGAVTTDVFINETDQVQRFDENGFTNLIINTDDFNTIGGVGMWQDHIYQTFDGTTATINITAKLTANNTAGFVDLVLNDLDGLDGEVIGDPGSGGSMTFDPNQGGEEYKYYVDLSQFDPNEFTTVSIPVASFDARAQAFETFNSGDGDLTDFNLYYLGLVTRDDPNAGAGLVGLEIESIQVTVSGVAASGDFNQDGVVDGRDFLLWQQNAGTNNGVRPVLDVGDADYDGDVDRDDLAIWTAQYGTGGLAATSATVPEPSAAMLLLVGAALVRFRRRTSQRSSPLTNQHSMTHGIHPRSDL